MFWCRPVGVAYLIAVNRMPTVEMTPTQAVAAVRERFPFPGYTDHKTAAYLTTAATVMRYLPKDSTILDFGCGPADKTAVLSLLGYRCTGYDDLGDEWHQRNGNRGRVFDFARSTGVEYVMARPGPLPFDPRSFDMVMALEVFEHFHDSPREILNNLIELLRDGGYVFVTVPNAANLRKRVDLLRGRTNLSNFRFFYWMPAPWRGHVREYVRDDLTQLCVYAGLIQRELQSCHHMLEEKRFPWIVRRAYEAAAVLFPGWRDTWLLVGQKPANWRRDANPPKLEELAAIYAG